MSEINEQQNSQPTLHRGGVKTEAGKAVSRYNAQRHAILRETLTEYEKIDVGQLYNEVAEDLKPIGRIQELLAEVIAVSVLKLQRIGKAEAEVIKGALYPDGLTGLKFRDDSYIPKVTPAVIEKLMLYSRYQTATENRIYRALAFFHQLKSHGQSTKTIE